MPRVALAGVLCALCLARLCAGALPPLQEEDPQTLSQMLQWSLEHQDLDALHAKAEAIRQRETDGEPEPGVLRQAALPAGDGGGPRVRQIRPESADPVAAALRQKELSNMWSTLMPEVSARKGGTRLTDCRVAEVCTSAAARTLRTLQVHQAPARLLAL
jgi:hypothetical protein